MQSVVELLFVHGAKRTAKFPSHALDFAQVVDICSPYCSTQGQINLGHLWQIHHTIACLQSAFCNGRLKCQAPFVCQLSRAAIRICLATNEEPMQVLYILEVLMRTSQSSEPI